MRCFIGIDLGSTTTKAVVLDEDGHVLGRGITNSRSNYDTAAKVAKEEAMVDARLMLIRRDLAAAGVEGAGGESIVAALESTFRHLEFLEHLADLAQTCRAKIDGPRFAGREAAVAEALEAIFARLIARSDAWFQPGVARKSDFFRDLAGSGFMQACEDVSRESGLSFDLLVSLYDKSIIEVENRPPRGDIEARFLRALERVGRMDETIAAATSAGAAQAIRAALAVPLDDGQQVGTGYGRVRLPFPKEQIRSEILCHGLGAHMMYPGTRTVLDIGGQDTKGIQVDGRGIVENFQMNDRCAAGCGRYLGYIADEMNMGLHELGPMAMQSTKQVRINSTCTVFAGAELRTRLALGERREDILAGLHRAIILRAMSILARAGGVKDQFTFTGGVARNEAAVIELRKLIRENYGDVTINITPESIFTGALGAAAFALRAAA